ncbi:MAG: M15 family metallopeptidase [Caldilineaceae bacterium]|nr:M15 family metallopeptidase [Caldilineaceae bacterium]
MPCDERIAHDLTPLLTKEFGISPDYAPDDLTPLADHAPAGLRIGQTILVREVIVEPLLAMLTEMQEAGLQPLIYSAYRSYRTQVATYGQWTRLYPERGPFLSAPAGHSEHQLGTTLDFGSPELAKIVGSQVRFHPDFAKTSEGLWLQAHAHEFGFTLSYPDGATDITGYYYEPWHYRYVGTELATLLHEQGASLTEYLSTTQPAPCTP